MTRTYWAAFAVQLLALPAMAQEAAPQEQPQPESATVVPEVVVEGRLPDVSNRIDRQVYRVEGDPQAESSNVLEILGNLPSVTVTPAGQVRLLGQGGVTIMVDGRVPPNPDAVLRGSKIWAGEWLEQRASTYKTDKDGLEEMYRERSMLKRSVFPEDIAEAIYFFASDASAKSTGNIINVDAGNAQSFTR